MDDLRAERAHRFRQAAPGIEVKMAIEAQRGGLQAIARGMRADETLLAALVAPTLRHQDQQLDARRGDELHLTLIDGGQAGFGEEQDARRMRI